MKMLLTSLLLCINFLAHSQDVPFDELKIQAIVDSTLKCFDTTKVQAIQFSTANSGNQLEVEFTRRLASFQQLKLFIFNGLTEIGSPEDFNIEFSGQVIEIESDNNQIVIYPAKIKLDNKDGHIAISPLKQERNCFELIPEIRRCR
ncbi:hypothetical protein [Halocola ammonii]